MSLLAALGIGVFCYFAVGFLTGHAPRLHRVRRPRPGVSNQQLWLTRRAWL